MSVLFPARLHVTRSLLYFILICIRHLILSIHFFSLLLSVHLLRILSSLLFLSTLCSCTSLEYSLHFFLLSSVHLLRSSTLFTSSPFYFLFYSLTSLRYSLLLFSILPSHIYSTLFSCTSLLHAPFPPLMTSRFLCSCFLLLSAHVLYPASLLPSTQYTQLLQLSPHGRPCATCPHSLQSWQFSCHGPLLPEQCSFPEDFAVASHCQVLPVRSLSQERLSLQWMQQPRARHYVPLRCVLRQCFFCHTLLYKPYGHLVNVLFTQQWTECDSNRVPVRSLTYALLSPTAAYRPLRTRFSSIKRFSRIIYLSETINPHVSSNKRDEVYWWHHYSAGWSERKCQRWKPNRQTSHYETSA